MHDPWMLVETTRVTEFEYYFACTCKDVHLRFIMSPNRVTLTFDFLDHKSIPNQDLSVSSLLAGTSLSAFHSLYVNNVYSESNADKLVPAVCLQWRLQDLLTGGPGVAICEMWGQVLLAIYYSVL